MEEAGVKLIVAGLQKFMGDMKSASSEVASFGNYNTILGTIFNSLGNTIDNFIGFSLRSLEHALGELLADAIEFVIKKLQELATEVIEAGNEFQTLEIRLQGLNYAEAIESGMDYTAAMDQAVEVTKEQLQWIRQLAVLTPFDATDIANVFTLARSYGFSAEEAQKLTVAVTNFTSGMGLSNVEVERIVTNLGQMVQQGKITSTEVRDLARGAFVPVADVLERVRIALEKAGTAGVDFTDKVAGLRTKVQDYETQLAIAVQRQSEFTETTAESTRMANQATIDKLTKQISDTNMELQTYNLLMDGSGTITKEMFEKIRREGIPAQFFIDSFIEMTGERFPDAAERMAKAFLPAIANLKDLVKSFFGANVIKTILDTLGEKISSFTSKFGEMSEAGPIFTELGERLEGATIRIGETIAEIIAEIFKLGPSADEMAEMFVGGIEKIAEWLDTNKADIITWAQNAITWIKEKVIPAVQELLKWLFGAPGGEGSEPTQGAIGKFFTWLTEEFIPRVQETANWFQDVLLPAIGSMEPLFAALIPLGEALFDVLLAMFGAEDGKKFADFIKEDLVPAIEDLTGWIRENKDMIAKLLKAYLALELIWVVISWIGAFIMKLIAMGVFIVQAIGIIGWLGLMFQTLRATVGSAIQSIWNGFEFLKRKLNEWKEMWRKFLGDVESAVKNRDWGALGKAIIDGLWNSVKWNFDLFTGYWKTVWENIVRTVKNILGIASPSAVFYDIGVAIMQGAANGVMAGASMLINAAVEAAIAAYEAVLAALGIGSPSKLFMQVGKYSMQGFAEGVMETSQSTAAVMRAAMKQVVASAASAPAQAYASASTTVQNTNTNNNYFNMNINSSASTEPIIQDYEMMQSLVGA